MEQPSLSSIPAKSMAEVVALPCSRTMPASVGGADQSGALVDLSGPAGALILASNGQGHAIRFGSRGDILALVLHLLALHDGLELRDKAGADAADAALDRIIAERATVGGHGHG